LIQRILRQLILSVSADLLLRLKRHGPLLLLVLPLLEFPVHFLQLLHQLSHLYVDLEVPYFLCYFEHFGDVGGVPLDGLDAHVVVHPLLHEGGLCEVERLLRQGERVQLFERGQVVQDVGLVVAQVADRVLAVVQVRERAGGEQRQPIEVEHLLEVSDLVRGDVQFRQVMQAVQTGPDGVNAVLSDVQHFESF